MKSTYTKRNGHERTKFKHKDSNAAATERRMVVIISLEKQLASGVKPNKGEDSTNLPYAPLTDKDRTRIGKELETLKQRI